MERRQYQRRSTKSKAWVYYQGHRICEYRIKDVSEKGLLLAHGPLMFHENTPLEIQFANGSGRRTYRVNVAHCTKKGMGLTMVHPGKLSRETIRRIVPAHPRAGA